MYLSVKYLEIINYIIVLSFSLFFVVYSVMNKRYRNIVLFVTLCIVLKILKFSVINSIVFAYVLCLIYGIIMNYHLLDNYKNSTNKKKIKYNESIPDRILNKFIHHLKKEKRFIMTRSVLVKDLKPVKQNISIDKVHN